MTVDTFDSPLQSIEFPAITLCPSNELQPDNWDLTEKVLNYFKFNCEMGNGDCNEVRKILEPLFQNVFCSWKCSFQFGLLENSSTNNYR